MVSSQQLVRLCAGHKPMRMRAALETLNHAERQRGRASAHGGRAAVFSAARLRRYIRRRDKAMEVWNEPAVLFEKEHDVHQEQIL